MNLLSDALVNPKGSYKVLRTEEDLFKYLRLCFIKDIRDPRLKSVHITSVSISKNLLSAKVFYIVPDDQKALMINQLKKCTGILRALLAKEMMLRVSPKLFFIYDEQEKTRQKIELLFDQIRSEQLIS